MCDGNATEGRPVSAGEGAAEPVARAPATGLADVLVAARRPHGRRVAGRHSPLYEWMWTRADVLAAEFDPPRRPNWASVAHALAAMAAAGATDVLDGQGGAPGAETVRQTWWKVRRDRRAAMAGPAPMGRPQPSARTSTQQPASPPLPAAVPSPATFRTTDGTGPPAAPPAYRFGTGVRAKGWNPGGGKAEE